jgi:pimeloyl-ACP methyl ester carboxylesterase
MSADCSVVLVHGAYAESSSWNGVIDPLQQAGHQVFAWPNPLRGVATDAAALTDRLRAIEGPVVLVGHSYGGAVITNVPAEAAEIRALVYIAGFALEPGESCGDAASLTPGSTLADVLERVPLADGGVDTYIAQAKYHQQFAADLPAAQASLMAVGQRPVTEAALFEASGGQSLWRRRQSWFLFGELDHNIPVGAHRIMAVRARTRRTVQIPGASHAVAVSRPAETAEIILDAARAELAAAA